MKPEKLNELLKATRDQKFRKQEQWKLNVANSNKSRAGTQEWKKVIDQRDYSYFQSEENRENKRNIKQQQLSNEEWRKKFNEKMANVYKSEHWREAVIKANTDPERNNKISKALSCKIQTPDGIFDSIAKCAEFYNITPEGVRYRCKTNKEWNKLSFGRVSDDTKKKLSLSNTKSKDKRLETIAAKEGYVYTPLGKFLSVRQAWVSETNNQLTSMKNPHVWFTSMNKKFPNKYYKAK